jgi:protein-L-isoaspartate(D-aspartate) O-methyltransferase
LVDQLAEGGLMVLPVGQTSRDQALLRLTRTPEGIVEEHLSEVRFVPLVAGIPGEAANLGQRRGDVA